MSRRPHPIENDPGDPDPRLGGMRHETVQQGRQALAIPFRIHHQHHRCPEQSCDLRRGSLRIADAPVEKSHDPFDHGDVGIPAAVPKQRTDQVATHQHAVEVAPRPPGSQRVVPGIDIVRPHLERRHPVTRVPQRAIKPVATVVFPLPEAGAAITTAGTLANTVLNGPPRHHHSMPR